MHKQVIVKLALFCSAVGLPAAAVFPCPFCQPLKTTFTEDIANAAVAVFAELVERPQRPDDTGELPAADLIDSYKTKFRITKIFKGEEHVKVGDEVIAIYTGEAEAGAVCLLRGVDPPALQWAPPLAMSESAQQYLLKVVKLPTDGEKRLDFFEDYLEDEEELLRNDSYDEFARAPYSQLQAISDDMDRERIIGWIKDPETAPPNRQLYFTMLSVCGKEEDAEMLAEFMTSGDRRKMTGLNSMIFCYLTLRGADGLPLIEDAFLRSAWIWDPEYVNTYAAIMAVRMLGQEQSVIERPRLVASLRIMLDRSDLADLVIPDLARWEDWASMDKLVAMFKDVEQGSSWVRVPIVNFLRACPLPEARDHLAALNEIDPDAVKRASTFYPFAAAIAKEGEASDSEQTAAADDATDSNEDQAVAQSGSDAAASDPDKAAASAAQFAASEKGKSKAAAKDQTADASEAAQSTAKAETADLFWLVGVPIAGAIVLFLLMWLILRRPREPMPAQHA